PWFTLSRRKRYSSPGCARTKNGLKTRKTMKTRQIIPLLDLGENRNLHFYSLLCIRGPDFRVGFLRNNSHHLVDGNAVMPIAKRLFQLCRCESGNLFELS